MPGKSSVREVLEALGRTSGGMKQRSDAVALLGIQVGRVQGANEFATVESLSEIRDGALEALKNTATLGTTDEVVQSHRRALDDVMQPLIRLIDNRVIEARKAQKVGPEKKKAEPVVEPVVQPLVENVPVVPLPTGRSNIRAGLLGGDLKDKMKEPTFLGEVKTWLSKADPSDPEERKDMVAAIKAMDPSDHASRKEAFELTFGTKILKSEARTYEPVLLRSGKPSMQGGKPVMREKLDTDAPLNPKALDVMATVMAELPAEHMPKGWMFEGQNADSATRGSYDDDTDKAQIRFSLLDADADFDADYAANCEPGDPLAKAKAFDLIVRHECGHKAASLVPLDELTGAEMGGAWVHHDTVKNVIDALSDTFQDFVTKVQKEGVPDAPTIRKAVENPELGFDAGAIAEALKLPEDRVPADHVLLQVLQQGAFKKYLVGSNPVAVGDRIFLIGGPAEGSWHSFSKTAWAKRVSLYQYAAPNEWFAEFYATANNGDEGIRAKAKEHYPAAWKWMNEHNCIVVGR